MKTRRNIFVLITAVLIVASYSVFFIIPDEERIRALAVEDGLFESAGAIFFLLAAILFYAIFLKHRKGTKHFVFKYAFFFIIGSIFFFTFGEEISWGQRIFHLSTPEVFTENNRQNEINIHNLDIFHGDTETGERKSFWALLLNFDRLFSIFWFGFCCLIPAVSLVSSRLRNFLEKIHFPGVPLFLGIFFLINYILSKIIEPLISLNLEHSLVEVKEAIFALLFFVIALWLFIGDREQKTVSERASQGNLSQTSLKAPI